jgi:hypothetical protein
MDAAAILVTLISMPSVPKTAPAPGTNRLLGMPAAARDSSAARAQSRRRVSCRVIPAQLVKHRLGHGCWQSAGVEPVAEVWAAERG